MRFAIIGLAMAIGAASPAMAEVKSVTPQGFALVSTVTVSAAPGAVFAAMLQPGRWWNPAHSYSGDGANMTLEPVAGGCFCEKLPKSGGQVEHMRVVYIQPGSAIRLRGALGPLQAEGVDGALTWTLKPAGTGTEISQTYVVGGYLRAGAETLAPPVDQVMTEQLTRLKAYLDKAK